MNTDNQGAIFIASFSDKCIREKVMMEKPHDWDKYSDASINGTLYQLEQTGKDYSACEDYEDHLASRRTFHYPVKEEQDGKELRENIDFKILFIDMDEKYNDVFKAILIEPEKHKSEIRERLKNSGDKERRSKLPEQMIESLQAEKHSPIEPDGWNLTDKELTKAGMLQTSAFNEPDTPLQPVKDEGWNIWDDLSEIIEKSNNPTIWFFVKNNFIPKPSPPEPSSKEQEGDQDGLWDEVRFIAQGYIYDAANSRFETDLRIGGASIEALKLKFIIKTKTYE